MKTCLLSPALSSASRKRGRRCAIGQVLRQSQQHRPPMRQCWHDLPQQISNQLFGKRLAGRYFLRRYCWPLDSAKTVCKQLKTCSGEMAARQKLTL